MLPFFRKTVFLSSLVDFCFFGVFFDVEALLFEHFKDLGPPCALWRVDCEFGFFHVF